MFINSRGILHHAPWLYSFPRPSMSLLPLCESPVPNLNKNNWKINADLYYLFMPDKVDKPLWFNYHLLLKDIWGSYIQFLFVCFQICFIFNCVCMCVAHTHTHTHECQFLKRTAEGVESLELLLHSFPTWTLHRNYTGISQWATSPEPCV
jgi:hypothetical protein